jgi:molybdopterin-guanine dinucleotide biosynthesis protein A
MRNLIGKLPISIVVQAGGLSTRMGQDKGLVPFLGFPMVRWVIQQSRQLSDDILIISNHPDEYKDFGVPVKADVISGIGALGGIYSGVTYSKKSIVLMLACDMPFVNTELIEYMFQQIENFDVVIPRLREEGSTEPFRAIYRKSCLDAISLAIQSGKRRAISFFDQVSVRYIEWDEIVRFDPGGITFFNVNTPEELNKAENIANELYPGGLFSG